MARITRKTLNIFANSAVNNGQFGSAQAGTKILSADPSVLQALAAWGAGWLSAVVGSSKFPALEEFQSVQYVHSYMQAYQFQEGIPEWDSGTTYFTNSIVKQPGTYILYGSVTNNNLNNALSDPTNWVLLTDLSTITTGFTTGDIKMTMKTAADSGWILCADGTIGSAASLATYANANAVALYTLLWNNVSNTYAPVSGGRGANAAADFAANKTIGLTKMLGRALAISGTGSGLTARTLGQTLGDENLAQHTHTITDPGHTHAPPSGSFITSPNTGNGAAGTSASYAATTASSTTGITVNNAGTGTAGNMQPTSFVNVMIKL